MRICIYEDSLVAALEPITLTRPAFALWCGAERLFERHARQFGARDVGFWTRPELADVWKLEQPQHPVNDSAWLRLGTTVWTNGRWLPDPNVLIDRASPHAGFVDGQLAYVIVPGGAAPDTPALADWLSAWERRLPKRPVGGTLLDSLWEVIEHNSTTLKLDGNRLHAAHGAAAHGASPIPANVAVTGPAERLMAAPDATLEPFVFVDTRGGPVVIDAGVTVQSFSRLEGPCYVGRDSWIVGAKLRAGTTIGPQCRIGGEVEASIVQGYSNKYHDGFLGHSYVGAWVNLAAATQTSDLRNDYDVVHVRVNGQRRSTGRTKVGAFIGDHSKTGLGALLNAGATVGAFSCLLPTGTLLPQAIPSFCEVRHGQLHELCNLRHLFHTADRVMQRRGQSFTATLQDYYHHLFEATIESRHAIMHESEMRRLRRSV
jgi:UDP-N-acetylglucosamine diphosphorylase / glucose-1-phosphate thymidylyltransferase / UDP-N-acetylgalactosamine diphosphorylase / glucosamine-1-phosphate N-acetyltransferase / galactosamine-1-phosphate N-acetyltransferase